MKLLACPKCHQQLHLENKTLKCENNHCYDISKRGYINLLLNPDKATNNPGDSKESLVARKAYLNKGYYDPILNQVITCIDEFKHQDGLSILEVVPDLHLNLPAKETSCFSPYAHPGKPE